MAGSVSWSRKSDDDWTAQVQRCVRTGERINITFANADEGFEGRISLEAKSEKQQAQGLFIFTADPQQTPKFTERGNIDGPEEIKAAVSGKLTKFRGQQIVFEGTWVEEDGDPWGLYIEATVA